MPQQPQNDRPDPEALRGLGNDPYFRRLLQTLPAAAYTCDPEGLITSFNARAEQLWGRAPALNDPRDRFCGSFRLFAVDGTPITHDRCWMALALQNGREYNAEEILIERPDGTRVTVLAHANPLCDDAGRLVGAVNVLVDLSDRKGGQEARRLLASIVESSDDAIVSKTLEGIILSWNAGAQRLFGYSAAEAVGSPITLIIPPERRDEEVEILSRLRRGERIEHFETVRVAKDGRRYDISLTISPICDESGKIVGVSKIARDITYRKQAELARSALKDELSIQLADLRRLHDMSVRLSTTLDLQTILDETLKTAAAIEGAPLGLLCLRDAAENRLRVESSLGFSTEFLKSIERCALGEGACGVCFREGRRMIVEDVETDPLFAPFRDIARQAGFRAVHHTPLITRSGDVAGTLTTHFPRPHRPSERELRLIDVCARQAVDCIENAKLYAELREIDRRKDEFLATLAHELRNPLAPITNSLHILRLTEDLSPAADRVREIIERQVNHLVRLVDDLLEVSRISRGKIDLRRERIELAAVIKSAVETSRPLIEQSGHQLAITLPAEPLTLEADPVRLAQVIANLLNNSAKYTEPRGQIWLTARREGNEIVISVRDTGLGISAEMLPRVFDMFSQVQRTLNRAQGGLGIGLNLARALVHLHQGSIQAHSDGPGQGSEFIVRLPLAVDWTLQSVPAPAPALASGRPELPARTILVVDDTRAAACTLGMLLEMMGQSVRIVHDAASALEQATIERPDVVISDIGMPDMDGYQLAQAIRERPELSGVVLVALTGYGLDSDRRRAIVAGFDYHLVKPVSLAALHDLLASLLPPPVAGNALSKAHDAASLRLDA